MISRSSSISLLRETLSKISKWQTHVYNLVKIASKNLTFSYPYILFYICRSAHHLQVPLLLHHWIIFPYTWCYSKFHTQSGISKSYEPRANYIYSFSQSLWPICYVRSRNNVYVFLWQGLLRVCVMYKTKRWPVTYKYAVLKYKS